MKKTLLSFLFIAAAFMVKAQDVKPTKEQTIEYIVNSLLNYKNHTEELRAEFDENGTFWFDRTDSILSIFIKDCKMSVKEYFRYRNLGKHEVKEAMTIFEVDLKDIETISIIGPIPEGSGRHVVLDNGEYSLKLSCTNGKQMISYNADGVVKTSSSFVIHVPNAEKLSKAFNHLRKLCGAPEPISF